MSVTNEQPKSGEASGSAHDVPFELIAKYDRPGPRYTSYPTAPEWRDLAAAEAGAAYARLGGQAGRISVYVHVPFCERMCLFCGCNVVAGRSRERVPRYVKALLREIDKVRELAGAKQTVQLHFWWRHADLPLAEELVAVTESIFKAFPRNGDAEVGIEVDPMITTRDHLAAARSVGFNRLSMGVQDFQDDVQAKVERFQPDAKSTEVFELARELGFASINLDLMYGLPGQTPGHLAHSARRAVALGADRVAVFGYAHVPWMKPHQKKLEAYGVPAAAERWAMFNAARAVFLDAGYQAIGMDHFAKPTDELALAWQKRRLFRNFQGYTVLDPTDLVGLGMTAIGDVGGTFVQNAKRLSAYEQAIEAGGLASEKGHVLTREDQLRRSVIISIMCNLRVRYRDFETSHGVDFRKHFHKELAALDSFVADDLVVRQEDGFDVSERGRVFVRNVAMVFDAYLAAHAGEEKTRFSRTV